jgi:predicted dehydrogenase
MSNSPSRSGTVRFTRRRFLGSAAAVGAGLMVTVPGWAQQTTDSSAKEDELAVGIIGPGSQGRVLINFCLKIPGLRFVAVCDIWPYHQRWAANLLKKYDQTVNVYEDYRDLLDKEKHLDAVIVATPDWVHAEHTNACLRAGKHVYCEKEMANTLAAARSMVETARQTGKLLQIGHQRRSSPRYWHALKMIEDDKILGRVTQTYGQWNRARLLEVGCPKDQELDGETLRRYGYGSMEELLNWRWYRKYSGGPIADLGSHQIDVFNWFLRTPPKSVQAGGGLDYYTDQPGRDWYDNVMTIYEWQTPAGPVRGFYQVLNTTSYGGFYEQFMGDEGTLVISDDGKTGLIFREVHAKRREWEDEAEKVETMGREAIELKIGETLTPEGKKAPQGQQLAIEAQKDSRQLHLENFFSAVRKGTPLTCPPQVAYETCVTVLKANDAIASGCRIEFKPEEFKV